MIKELEKIIQDLRNEVVRSERPAENYKKQVKNELIRRRFATIANRIEKAINTGNKND